MAGGVGHMGGLTNPPAPGAEDAEPVILIPVGLPCLKRGRLYQKKSVEKNPQNSVFQHISAFTILQLYNVSCIKRARIRANMDSRLRLTNLYSIHLSTH